MSLADPPTGSSGPARNRLPVSESPAIGRSPTALLLFAVALSLALGGCVSTRGEYYEELGKERARAYARWKRKDEDPERPILEGRLELEGAVRIALQHNTGIKATIQEKERARGRRVGAYSEVLPTVDLSADYRRFDQIFTVDLGVDSFQIGDRDNFSYRAELTQPLYKGGAIGAALRASRIFDYLSDERVRATVEGAIFEVASAYYDAVLARRLIEVQEAALRSARSHLEDVRSRHTHGLATEFDVLRARVDVSNAQADLIQQRNREDRAMTRLLRAMGASQRSRVSPASDLSYQDVRPEFAEAVGVAFRNRPDIYVAELNRDLQAEAVTEAKSRYFPRLSAYYWHLWAKPDPQEASNIEWDDDWEAGLRLTWPIFDGLAREGNIIEQQALLRQSEIELSDAQEKAIQQVRNALLELQNARELVQTQELNLKRADRALELVQVGYREGVNTEVEVLDARTALTRTRGLYYQALHRHVMARLNLRRAQGILGAGPGARAVPEEVPRPDRLPGDSADRQPENGREPGTRN